MPELSTYTYAFLGGLLPALLWLWFWLKEDKKRPEPRGLIVFAFIAGMIAVPLVLPLEKFAAAHFTGFIMLVLWSASEEILKYLAAFFSVLKRKEMDEPVDAVMYMITVALGFAALENTFFLLNPLSDGNVIGGIITGYLRFVGATLLHVLASATIGLAIALSFYKSRAVKRIYLLTGIALAVILHSLFNFFIMESNGDQLFTVFLSVWAGIIILILLLEKVKRMRKPRKLFIRKTKHGAK